MSLTLFNILLISSSLSHSLTHYEPNLLPSNSDGYCNVTDTVSDYRENKCLNTWVVDGVITMPWNKELRICRYMLLQGRFSSQ